MKKEDVEEFGDSYNNHFQNSIVSIEEDSAFRGGFYAGYNAKKGEFTIEQLKTAWAYGVEASGTFEDVLKIVQPLSLPKSIEVDESYNITKVNW